MSRREVAMGKKHGRPSIESMVLCDEVRHSGNTKGMADGVYDLIHVRTTLQIPTGASFPYYHPVLFLFLRICGRAGLAKGTLDFGLEGQKDSLWKGELQGPIELWGFNKSAHVTAQLVDVEFPRFGVYWFRVRIRNGPVSEIRLLVE